ncbi:hypothetical protein FOZ60_003634 [Perkinsus olseni]|nr:hypothetical protein FOZ60_003634 [Perkinsus olseni]
MSSLLKLIVAVICILTSYGGTSCPGCLFGRYELDTSVEGSADFTPPIRTLQFGLSQKGDCKITFTVVNDVGPPTDLHAFYTLTRRFIRPRDVHVEVARHMAFFKRHESRKTLKKLIFDNDDKVIWIHWRQGYTAYRLDPSSTMGR